MIASGAQPEAGQRGDRGRVNGVLLLDKPEGISSQAAVTRAKRLLSAAKAGHTGTLDPMASGLLPVCLGEATKFSHWLLDGDKTYAATVRLGLTTTTGDLEGTVTSRAAADVPRERVEAVLERFQGELMQTPPMYSALKYEGQPLYKHARAGRDVPRAPRPIRIVGISLANFARDALEIVVTCSKGTYIRVLAEDIGRELGCGACLAGLRRTGVGMFQLGGGAISLEGLDRLPPAERMARLLPVDALVAVLPRIDLDDNEARHIATGRALERACGPGARTVRIYGPARGFLGVAEVEEHGRIVPRRLVAQDAAVRPAIN